MSTTTTRGVVGAMMLAALVTMTGCAGDSPTAPSTSPVLPNDSGSLGVTPKHTFAEVPIADAEVFAIEFIKLYGSFSPANPDPGRTWMSTWRSLAMSEVSERAETEFDRMWGWTWDQQAQAQDVLPTGPAQIGASFGTVTVRVPARRYVLGLLAQRVADGHWENLHFEVVVGPRRLGDANSDLAVYRAEMRGA
ncbi:hypothetical protein O4328_29065 [Rhodococcus opacus]|uniref:Lipoprotein n=1 Tax=Rhodococcus opacus TaxID=37919 RepID=A0AAX3YQE2_RHOOP|nr:hypothetical protein [Rhodococcus opacus]MCZ4587693.1 hypothetical protein [Rhodococcus opacus]WLF51311.1 hypothetical protein Q5707_38775 [Rhodococcus opacus]